MLKSTVIASLISCVMSVASAQDISIKMDQIVAGSYLMMEQNGSRLFHVFRGAGQGGYVVDIVMDSDPNAPRQSRWTRTKDGNATQIEITDGNTVRFEPHNCQRVVGQCQFTAIGPDYRTTVIRINTLTSNGFDYKVYSISADGEPTLFNEGRATGLDAMGNYTRATSESVESGSSTYRVLQAIYR
jgi:hypothetical protein